MPRMPPLRFVEVAENETIRPCDKRAAAFTGSGWIAAVDFA
jgi:hypothetical protein